MEKEKYDFEKCLAIIRRLRSEKGCAWDNDQTLDTLKKYFLEEVYEALDAMDRRNFDNLKEELGDVIWEVLFVARIAEQEGQFKIEEIFQVLGEKMVRRHPHIFGESQSLSAEQVWTQWGKIKKQESNTSRTHHILAKIPQTLPALLRAFRISERAAKTGFDWDNPDQVLAKVREEMDELDQARQSGDKGRMEQELGDVIFALVNYGRHLQISAEDGLRQTTDTFVRRFEIVEDIVADEGGEIKEKSLAELEAIWQRAKKMLSKK